MQKYKGKLVTLGADPLAYNEYSSPRQTKLHAQKIDYVPGKTYADGLWTTLLAKLPDWNIKPHVKLTDSKGSPIWGVEYLQANTADGTIVNLCNYLNNAEDVKLSVNGKTVKVIDILTGKPVTGVINLQPLEVRLVKIEQVGGK